MSMHLPELTPAQIARWIQDEAATHSLAPSSERRQYTSANSGMAEALFDTVKIRQALNRARAKTNIPTIKPLRRLRTNQGAVNQSLIDSLGGTVTVVELLVAEVRALHAEIAGLRAELNQPQDASAVGRRQGGAR